MLFWKKKIQTKVFTTETWHKEEDKHQNSESLVKSGDVTELTAASVFDVRIWHKCFITFSDLMVLLHLIKYSHDRHLNF